MTDDIYRQLHDLLANTRAVATALTDPKSNFALNADLGTAAYVRGPEHAVLVAAQIARIRLDQINQVRLGAGRAPMPFPREELLVRMKHRLGSVTDSIDFLEKYVHSVVPEREPIDELIRKHGLIAFMMLIQIANEIGKMLVDVDSRFDRLSDLFAQEALADETEWLNWPDPT